MKIIKILFIVIFAFVLFSKSKGQESLKLPRFSLLGVDGKTYTQNSFSNYQNIAVIFYSNHCRVSQKFEKLIIQLSNILANNKSNLILVSPNFENAILPDEKAYSDVGDSFEEMKIRAKKKNFNFPYLYDGENQSLANQMGVKATPHGFLFNKNRKLIYSGRIGDLNKAYDLNSSDLFIAYLKEKKGINSFFQTKVFGTSIKTREDLHLADKVRKRYSEETIRVTHATQKKLKFFLNHPSESPKLVYVWSNEDKENRDNLLAISSVYKIYRKRGLKVYTVCIGENLNLTKETLSMAQLSAVNFLIDGKDFSPLAKYHPNGGEKVTPFTVLLDKNGKIILNNIGFFDHLLYKIKIKESL